MVSGNDTGKRKQNIDIEKNFDQYNNFNFLRIIRGIKYWFIELQRFHFKLPETHAKTYT